ncbi:hypothetical protein JOE30_002094 [Rhodococcus sp. PvP016]|uniref:Secreted protein n=1 Tax=Rhodococcoides corynebacterioides TaxID=53972 RepID=A0ABS2KPE6_9NOCA|nr:hypothetical protein [Rhodococcus corynebacterioides]MBP1116297.1 hypothetical protein [Rhodococcus sp. PvP016]
MPGISVLSVAAAVATMPVPMTDANQFGVTCASKWSGRALVETVVVIMPRSCPDMRPVGRPRALVTPQSEVVAARTASRNKT